MIRATPAPNGSILSVVDAEGAAFAAELAPGRIAFRSAETDGLYSFNYYHCPELADAEVPWDAHPRGFTRYMLRGHGVHEHNAGRKQRWEDLRSRVMTHTIADMQNILADHGGGNGGFDTICRHHASTMSTIASVVMNPVLGEMTVTFGKACSGERREFRLDKTV